MNGHVHKLTFDAFGVIIKANFRSIFGKNIKANFHSIFGKNILASLEPEAPVATVHAIISIRHAGIILNFN